MTKVSVCMPTFNGGQYLHAQIFSILGQLAEDDELIISDDGSTDDTLAVIYSFHDARIKVIKREGGASLPKNVENALRQSTGEYVFLADQDDVWCEGRVTTMMAHLEYYDLVVSDCFVTDSELNITHPSLFALQNSQSGFFKNFFKNTYVGCCMAFNRKMLKKILPIPHNIPMHDWWIGMIGDCFFKTYFINEQLLYYRRHDRNISFTSKKSANSLRIKIFWRLILLYNLFLIIFFT